MSKDAPEAEIDLVEEKPEIIASEVGEILAPAMLDKAGQEFTPESQASIVPHETMTEQSPIALAMRSGASAEELLKFFELQKAYEANEARKAYARAMAAFKANPPELFKNKLVEFQSNSGLTSYKHATLDHVANAISAAMAPHGLSFSWNTEQLDGNKIRVTCIVAHAAGHSESVALSSMPDDSGKKNKIQQVGSTVTYLQRYTLLAATGLAAGDTDDDGRGAEPVELISDSQLADLEAKIEETGANAKLFCKAAGIDDLQNLPADKFQAAINRLEERAKNKGAASDNA